MGVLTIEDLRCANLRNTGTFGTSDPFIVMELGSAPHCTTGVKDNDLNPDWTLDTGGARKEFKLKVADPATQTLVLKVMDKNKVR